jgi:carbon storage regulator
MQSSGQGKHVSFKEDEAMLVLSRKVGEQIIIDGGITVTVTSIDGGKVRIGISAPPAVRIDRAEVHQRICEFAEPADRQLELVTAGV